MEDGYRITLKQRHKMNKSMNKWLRYSDNSIKIFKAKQLFYLFVMRILISNPLWIIICYPVPKPVSEVRVEKSTWMETISRFDQLFWRSVFKHCPVEHLFCRKVVVSIVIVFESSFCSTKIYLYTFDNFLAQAVVYSRVASSELSHPAQGVILRQFKKL